MKTERELIEKLKVVLNPFAKFAEERLKNRIAGNNQVVLEYNGRKLLFQNLVDLNNLFDEISALEKQMDKEEMPVMPEGRENCPDCDGFGYTVEHDPCDPHPDGECSGGCPIQVECQKCKSTGWINSPVNIETIGSTTNWEREFIDWDNAGHSNASQRDIINWFKKQMPACKSDARR